MENKSITKLLLFTALGATLLLSGCMFGEGKEVRQAVAKEQSLVGKQTQLPSSDMAGESNGFSGSSSTEQSVGESTESPAVDIGLDVSGSIDIASGETNSDLPGAGDFGGGNTRTKLVQDMYEVEVMAKRVWALFPHYLRALIYQDQQNQIEMLSQIDGATEDETAFYLSVTYFRNKTDVVNFFKQSLYAFSEQDLVSVFKSRHLVVSHDNSCKNISEEHTHASHSEDGEICINAKMIVANGIEKANLEGQIVGLLIHELAEITGYSHEQSELIQDHSLSFYTTTYLDTFHWMEKYLSQGKYELINAHENTQSAIDAEIARLIAEREDSKLFGVKRESEKVVSCGSTVFFQAIPLGDLPTSCGADQVVFENDKIRTEFLLRQREKFFRYRLLPDNIIGMGHEFLHYSSSSIMPSRSIYKLSFIGEIQSNIDSALGQEDGSIRTDEDGNQIWSFTRRDLEALPKSISVCKHMDIVSTDKHWVFCDTNSDVRLPNPTKYDDLVDYYKDLKVLYKKLFEVTKAEMEPIMEQFEKDFYYN
ncbi:MAG: hypothetical protein AB8E15_02560 [Bdellovibrionales bacterium]